MTNLPRHLLPESLHTIAVACGDEVMWAVWERYGGGRLHIPRKLDPGHPLAQSLGCEIAQRLSAEFGGEFLTIPRALVARRAVRNALIRAGRTQGCNNFTLARRFEMTDRQISKICRAVEPPAVNADLFDTTP